jgi:hypothetical protein
MKTFISKTLTEQISKRNHFIIFPIIDHGASTEVLANDSTLRIEYLHNEKKLVEGKGIVIHGWTYSALVSPSNFKKLADITELYEAVREGRCKAIKLSTVDWNARIASNLARVARGELVYPPCEAVTKKTLGKRKAATQSPEEEEEEEENDEEDGM